MAESTVPQATDERDYAVLSLPNFRLPRSRSLSLSAAARRTTPAASATGADFFLADCCSQIRGDDGARASGADADVGGRRRGEVRGRLLIAGLLRAAAGSLRRALSPEFPAAALAVFIPLRGRAPNDTCCLCWWRRFHFSDCGWCRSMELGRLGPMLMSAVAGAARYGVAG